MKQHVLRFAFALNFAVIVLLLAGCRQGDLDVNSVEYRDAVAAYYTGLAAMQVGEDRRAEEKLLRVTEIESREPSAWANLGILALRRNELDLAEERLTRARELAPENSHIEFLFGRLAATRGETDAAISHFTRARELAPSNIKATYALAEQIEQRGGEEADEEVRRHLDEILQVDPDNLTVLVEWARLNAIVGDREALDESLRRLEAQSSRWSDESRRQLATVRAASGDLQETSLQLSFLNNVLKREPEYRESVRTVRTEPGTPGDVVTSFLKLPMPRSQPAPPDDSISFAVEPLFPGRPESAWRWARAVMLSPEGLPVVLAAAADEILIEGPEPTALPAPAGLAARGLAPIDYNYDFRVDLALAGAGGFILYRQESDNSFTDVTRDLGLPRDVLTGAYSGAWAADLDMEGDLDLILAAENGPPVVLRNNGDGTFTPFDLFGDVSRIADFVWADLDGDGDPDAVFLGMDGTLHVYENQRSRGFNLSTTGVQRARAVTVADLDADGAFEIVVLQDDGRIIRLNRASGAFDGERADLASWNDMPPMSTDADGVNVPRLIAADLDNNGSLDLLASAGGSTAIWLSRPAGELARLKATTNAATYSLSDLTGSGRLDLIGTQADTQPVRLANRGTKIYHSKSIRPQAADASGDQRINPFGLGGEIEMRSGALFQKKPIIDPDVHFGLGENLVVDVVRIIWPNGDIQAEFDLLSDETVQARQRLKGSCPWLFAYDGEEMRFVTDFIWRSPLGLRINAQETAGVMMTEDWVKIDGDELRPRDGEYDLRITAELWETHFFDHVSLLVVDHPAETEIFVDERFAFPPPALQVQATGRRRPVRAVRDDQGNDVTEFVRELDERYLAAFEIGQYQGIARDHAIEIDLSDTPADAPVYLLAEGWIRPTDSSINVAVSQGTHEPPRGLRMDVADGRGGWKTVRENLGFPAGKRKTILIDLTDVFVAGADRHVRLSTNLEIYWDAIWWAEARPDADVQTVRLDPATAELRFRGFSVVSEPERTRPEVPTYELMTTVPLWQDLSGYYTRFGDVRELLKDVDDRYVIMNAGDEMAFRFPAQPEPAAGYVRDYVLIGDGWVKDGDYNTTFSEYVLPLPTHASPDYSTPPTSLEDDPVFKRHVEDWRRFHTRYVTPAEVRAALRF